MRPGRAGEAQGAALSSTPALCRGLTGLDSVPPWESFGANPRLMRAQEQSKALLGRE